MSIAACNNCGAKENIRCVDDHCCNRDERDAVFLGTVGQSWQSEANRLLDAWAAEQAELNRLHVVAAEYRAQLEQANDRCNEARGAFDTFMYNCMKIRAQVMP